MRYVVHRRFRDKCLCGYVNLPYGTVCESIGEVITKDGKSLVIATSENAHQYFARDDDGNGKERGKLTQQIQELLRPPKAREWMPNTEVSKHNDKYEKIKAAWERIWNDPRLQPYKMREHADYWLWNHAFFNAEISELKYILNVVKGGSQCTE